VCAVWELSKTLEPLGEIPPIPLLGKPRIPSLLRCR
jgi:hypothetical protein